MGGCGAAPSPPTCTISWLLVFFCVARVVGRDVGGEALMAARLRHETGFVRHHHQHYQQLTGSSSNSIAEESEDSEEPQILAPKTSDVSTRVGQSATFTCVVKHLGNRQVWWIRGRDLHVLSSGQVTFSSDARLIVSHSDDSWTLTIKFSQPHDAGPYSCHVNTQPPLAVWYNLTVIGLVLWYQDDRLVERQSARVTVANRVTNITTSTLTVEAAALKDFGNYSCWPSAGRADTVLVHVIQGDPLAAMQHGNSAPGACPLLLVPMTLTSLMFFLT